MGAGASKFDKDARDEFMNNVHNVSGAFFFSRFALQATQNTAANLK